MGRRCEGKGFPALASITMVQRWGVAGGWREQRFIYQMLRPRAPGLPGAKAKQQPKIPALTLHSREATPYCPKWKVCFKLFKRSFPRERGLGAPRPATGQACAPAPTSPV